MLTAKLLLVVLVRAELPENTTGIAMPPAWNISHLVSLRALFLLYLLELYILQCLFALAP